LITRKQFLAGASGALFSSLAGSMRVAASTETGTAKETRGVSEYESYDALGLAELVRNGDVTAEELLEEAISQTEAINPKINAVVYKHYDLARAAISAGLPQGPFTGVPFLLKNQGIAMQGTITSHGSRFLKTHVDDYDSTLNQRYRAAGFVIFGKTNSPEFGLSVTTEPLAHGKSRNPWNPERSTGGSSGGSGAAVAAGIVPMAHAADGGGSIRIPASCNGVFGLKPTRGRVPQGPTRGESWNGLSCPNVVSRTVRDTAAVLEATSAYDPGAPYGVPGRTDFLKASRENPGQRRIALIKAGPDVKLDPDVVKILAKTAELCTGLGHIVEEIECPVDRSGLGANMGTIVTANVQQMLQDYQNDLGRDFTADDLEWTARQVLAMDRIDAADYVRAVQSIHRAGLRMGQFQTKYDFLLEPTLAKPPQELDKLFAYEGQPWGETMRVMSEFSPFTSLYNMTGQPAMSVPLGMSGDGLPIGMMFVGRFGDEAGLLSLAGQLEEAAPWKDRRPV
jgi:amidase/6-aminohexanoate-cyclic-dimer hydrolase